MSSGTQQMSKTGDQGGKRGPKPRHPGAGWVLFEVSPAVFAHLQRLVRRSALGETPDEVAKALFTREAMRSMKDNRYEADPANWFEGDFPGASHDEGQDEEA